MLVLTLIVVAPKPFTEGGLNVAPAPDGSPLTLKPTSVKPDSALTVTV